jgi:hypothetical protein
VGGREGGREGWLAFGLVQRSYLKGGRRMGEEKRREERGMDRIGLYIEYN